MDKFLMKLVAASALFAVILLVAPGVAAESKYTTSAAGSSIVTFGPTPGGFKVTGLYAKADTNPCPLVIYSRTSASSRKAPTAVPTNGQSVIAVANTAVAVSNGDHVVYVHANGALLKTTVSAATATNVTLATALSTAGASGDYLFEINPAFQIDVPSATPVSEYGGNIFAVPGEWPVSLVLAGGTNSILGATTDR